MPMILLYQNTISIVQFIRKKTNEFKTWKILGKTIYHFLGKNIAKKFAYINKFWYICIVFPREENRDKIGTRPRQN